jgi:hypothetical protein
MSEDVDKIRSDIEHLLDGLRQDLLRGSVTLYREHLADDATLLAIDNPELFRGKEQCIDYVRHLGQVADIHALDADVEDLKLLGDVAVVVERHTIRYGVRGQTYRDSGRTTWVLHRISERWMVAHSHWESLAPNRIVDREP